ncbi:MAG: phosphoribosylaminoimidazolesuccinocarboxamide synthase [Desulfovibrionaceae bacterium]|nr:phosphoribosylaminoimidazolesuccinocarboxamide synthase [Desulfovibrionaceae bacterium]
MIARSLAKTELPGLALAARGKVRDIYELSSDSLLIVTTDRISAFDVILPDPIPHKGKVLNQITLFWMAMMSDLAANHILAADVEDFPARLKPHAELLRGRSVVVRRTAPLPVECIVRGYLSGSGWKDYRETGRVCGHELPAGLEESAALPEPLFTPSTKAELGRHDQNISLDEAGRIIGPRLSGRVRDVSLAIYERAAKYALERGIIIADTKFEFGLINNSLLLIDEVLTPDSSRFWPRDGYRPGRGQPSFDKQYVRDWLESVGFDKNPPAPHMPSEVARETSRKYIEAFRLLTGFDPVL